MTAREPADATAGTSPEEIGEALALGADDDGGVAARPPGQVCGGAREWWPGMLAVLYAVGPASAASWVIDPDGYDLEITRPGEPVVRFAARDPRRYDQAAGQEARTTAADGIPSRDDSGLGGKQ